MATAKTVTDTAKTKATVKKTTVKKAVLKTDMTVQFAGKSYSQEDLVKMAKDVWKTNLKKKVSDLVSAELYVKPEENKVYCVFNGDITGSFEL